MEPRKEGWSRMCVCSSHFLPLEHVLSQVTSWSQGSSPSRPGGVQTWRTAGWCQRDVVAGGVGSSRDPQQQGAWSCSPDLLGSSRAAVGFHENCGKQRPWGRGCGDRAKLDGTFWETLRLPGMLDSFVFKSHCKTWRGCPGVRGRR